MRPEDYWINLGENVIGQDVLADGENARQANTYRILADTINQLEAGYTFSLLDIGCNYGVLDDWLDKTTFRGDYNGIDSNQYAVALASSRGIKVRCANLREMDYADRTFDIVVMKDVIEHLETVGYLREAFRVANWYLILSLYLPLHDAPTQVIHNQAGYYTNTYNRQDVMRLAKECGFTLVRDMFTKETNGTDNEIIVWGRDAN